MICKYCGNECQFVELDDVQDPKTIEVWKCTNCPVVVRYSKFINEDYPSMVCLSMKMNERRYAVQYIWERNFADTGFILSTEIVEVKPLLYWGEQMSFNIDRIATFQGHINITPSNIGEKLPIYITFS